MHIQDISPWKHDHVFDESSHAAERGTRAVMWITAVMMVIEIAAGWQFNSMALLADGWHMSSHAVAIGLSAFAYAAARRYEVSLSACTRRRCHICFSYHRISRWLDMAGPGLIR